MVLASMAKKQTDWSGGKKSNGMNQKRVNENHFGKKLGMKSLLVPRLNLRKEKWDEKWEDKWSEYQPLEENKTRTRRTTCNYKITHRASIDLILTICQNIHPLISLDKTQEKPHDDKDGNKDGNAYPSSRQLGYNESYTVQRVAYSTKSCLLYKESPTVQWVVHCTKSRLLYKESPTVQTVAYDPTQRVTFAMTIRVFCF